MRSVLPWPAIQWMRQTTRRSYSDSWMRGAPQTSKPRMTGLYVAPSLSDIHPHSTYREVQNHCTETGGNSHDCYGWRCQRPSRSALDWRRSLRLRGRVTPDANPRAIQPAEDQRV